jgi:hypothetical protein
MLASFPASILNQIPPESGNPLDSIKKQDALVEKLRRARQRVRAEMGRCEGRKPVPAEVVAEARRLHRQNPKTHTRRSLREIAAKLAAKGLLTKTGKLYSATAVRRMLLRENAQRTYDVVAERD